jgi:hypothetical protein
MYGPTETTIYSTISHLHGCPGVSIGQPIANTRAYVLSEVGEPVPLGVKGELYIGGSGVARGYLGKPELTAERFLPDAFSSESGSRLYRTGDQVRYSSSSNIDFLGRLDHQVKVRGYRIELGEIEHVLAQHQGVRQTLVLFREDSPGNPRLVAYVVPDTGPVVSVRELSRSLKMKLPEYMIPSAFVILESLPLSSNGKIDRRALPTPGYSDQQRDFVAPRTPTEEALGEIWTEMLSLERVGVNDSFFEIGGHSLLAAQVISRIRTTFRVELPLRSLFEATTIEALARVIDEMDKKQDTPQKQAIPRLPREQFRISAG